MHCSNNAGVFMKQFVASDEGIEYMFTVHDLGTNPELFLPLKFFFPYRLNEFLKAILHMAYFRMNQMQPVCFRACNSCAIKSHSACQIVPPLRLLQSSPKLGKHTHLCQWAVRVRVRERDQRDKERGAWTKSRENIHEIVILLSEAHMEISRCAL